MYSCCINRNAGLYFLCFPPSLTVCIDQHTGLSAPVTTTATAAAASAEPEEVPSASASQAAARPTASEHGHIHGHKKRRSHSGLCHFMSLFISWLRDYMRLLDVIKVMLFDTASFVASSNLLV